MSNQFWNLIANVSITLQNEKTSTQKPDLQMKKLFIVNNATIFTNKTK